MKIMTRVFGEIETDDVKVINFEKGIIGFPGLKKFMLLHDEENAESSIIWLQSIDEPEFALPVADPLSLIGNYNPTVEDDMLNELGDFTQEDLLVLVTMTIPSDLTKMTTNLKAPIIVNSKTLKACQIIAEDEQYSVKFPIYEILKKNKEES